ncbi:cisplatin damage response ATP-dependent DNA ligase [Sandaracinobacteroides hominis]|uniref:cisplatin damage response ATP-dependent DNA ligase n=1 Tax=Sandaracinobacteroides hominis TaxID=2780086 RepID=UPI0018F3997A|nr:cisplatin damage response ATP-dependent DNA ligase [Sandaracinobacteroides hominis]
MSGFAELLDSLSFTAGRNARLKLMADWLRDTPDPDRGWGLAALTGGLSLPGVKPALIRGLIEERVDPMLFRLSYDYVGDLAETVSLLWEGKPEADPPGLAEVVERLRSLSRSEAPAALSALLDRLDATGRYALLKLATGNLRVGAGARLARVAFAQAFGVSPDDVEELWHGVEPPYAELFAWGEGRGPRPDLAALPLFRPFMLAHPLEDPEALDVAAYAAEWKWDGIRAMAVRVNGQVRLYSRDGNDISATFPEIATALQTDAVIDGELLVRGEGAVGSFNALQQRLGRKTVSAAMQAQYPVLLRCYDLLFDGAEDVRELPLGQRRARLTQVVERLDPTRFDLSPDLHAETLEDLARLRAEPPDPAIEGLMLKRRDSSYSAGRRAGLWYKWKRPPLTADCVLMYAQRGHGKRSSFYSDFTFGAWSADGQLLPVGKAYFGFTDAELKWLDQWVRTHTTARFGPVREVEKQLVLEVAFDSIGPSSRHKSGLAMRFPRISRIRTDKPAAEADRVETLQSLAKMADTA